MSVVRALEEQLRAAMLNRDRVVVAALRATLSSLANAQAIAPPDPSATQGSVHVAGASAGAGSTEAQRRVLPEDEQRGVVEAEMDELTEHAGRLADLGRTDESRAVQRAVGALRRILA